MKEKDIAKECVFCKIARGEIPCAKIWEDEEHLAFLDINPINPGHTLVIPKQHYDSIFSLPEKLSRDYFSLIRKLAIKIREALNARWANILIFGEEIKHAHVHIIPRFKDDGFKYPIQKQYKEGEMEQILNKLKC